MPAWEPLMRSEEDAIWDHFHREFDFRPSVHAENFPGIREPAPSTTYALPRSGWSEHAQDLNDALLTAFRACVPPSEAIYALDWQHECYRLRPHLPFDDWPIPILPNGDYYIFLSTEFAWGTFGHPWEWTICVFGEPLLAAIGQRLPLLFGNPIRSRCG